MAEQSLQDLVEIAVGVYHKDLPSLKLYDQYKRGEQSAPYGARGHTEEFRALAKRSVYNWVGLAVNIPCQMSIIDGYRVRNNSDPDEFEAFKGNRMERKQLAIHEAAATYGHAFAEVEMPDDGAENAEGVPIPSIRALPTMKMVVLYEDPFNDRFPVFAMRLDSLPGESKDGEATVWYGPDKMRISWRNTDAGHAVQVVKSSPHGFPVIPIVRWVTFQDLEGRTCGVVQPLIQPQDEVNQGKYDLNVTRNFSAYKIRTASGLEGEPVIDPDTGEQIRDENGDYVFAAPEIGPEKFLVSEDDTTKFGTLDETPLDGFISSLAQSVEHFAAVSQIPPHALQGRMANLSAEALVAAEEQLMRLVGSYQRSWGDSWCILFQLVAYAQGQPGALYDFSGQIRWREMRARSIAEIVDALGKGAQMLGIPQKSLWSRFPDVDAATLQEWKEAADALPPVEQTEHGNALNMSRALTGLSTTAARSAGTVPARRTA